MRARNPTLALVLGLALLPSGAGQAGPKRSLGIQPDPACRTHKLVVPAEQTLAENLQAPGVFIDRKEPAKARLLLQYMLTLHASGESVVVQLDGQIFGNADGKLYAEGSVRSDGFGNDDAGQAEAARQAGRRLGQHLSDSLVTALAQPARGRKIMLQVSLSGAAVADREQVTQRLQRALGKLSLRPRGSTERNLVWTLFATETSKDLVEQIERALKVGADRQLTWLVQSDNTLMLQLGEASR